MADFEACYFCGAGPDATLSAHGVVPGALSPDESVQRSVTLCPACREKLVAVLEPVVEAATDGTASAGADAGGTRRADDAGGRTASTGDAGEEHPRSPAVDDGSGREGRRSVDLSEDDADEGVAIARPDGRDPVAGDDVGGDEGADDEDVGINRTSPTDEDARTESPGPARGPSAPAEASPDDGEELTGGDPESYRKVVRLLQNREFPVQRDTVVELAAGAYGLSPGEVDGALTAMVQKGLITEEEGTLRRA